jgi:hypothetical protein
MEQRLTWQADSSLEDLEITRILCSPKVQNRVRKRPLLVSLPWGTSTPIRNPRTTFKNHTNIIFPSTTASQTVSLPSGFPTKMCMCASFSPFSTPI